MLQWSRWYYTVITDFDLTNKKYNAQAHLGTFQPTSIIPLLNKCGTQTSYSVNHTFLMLSLVLQLLLTSNLLVQCLCLCHSSFRCIGNLFFTQVPATSSIVTIKVLSPTPTKTWRLDFSPDQYKRKESVEEEKKKEKQIF